MLTYKIIRNVNDKLATFAYALHYILLWPSTKAFEGIIYLKWILNLQLSVLTKYNSRLLLGVAFLF